MKKAVLVLVGALMMASCSNGSKMENEAISVVKEQCLDPNSFELIKTEVDTCFYHFRLENMIWIDSSNIDLAQHSVNLWEDSKNSYGKGYYEEAVIELAEAQKSLEEHLTQLQTEPNAIEGYIVRVRFYANSKGGLHVINDANVFFDKNMNFEGKVTYPKN